MKRCEKIPLEILPFSDKKTGEQFKIYVGTHEIAINRIHHEA